MLWEVYQQTRVNAAEQSAERAESKAGRASDDIAQLRRQIDRLALASQAMWELLRDSSGLTEDDLQTKILEIDLRDGKADGKITSSVCVCPSCGHNTNTRRSLCLMCGAPLSKQHAFES
jgi:rRNA maturation endonuclease Nob1